MCWEAYMDNRYYTPVEYQGLVYPSAENAYQASKFSPARRTYFTKCNVSSAISAGERHMPNLAWNQNEQDIMSEILKSKFSDPDLNARLKSTDGDIVFINNRHDNRWGICNCPRCQSKGFNRLGKLLTEIRKN